MSFFLIFTISEFQENILDSSSHWPYKFYLFIFFQKSEKHYFSQKEFLIIRFKTKWALMSFFAQTRQNISDCVSTIPKMNLLASWLTAFPRQGAAAQHCFALKRKARLSTWVQAPRVCLWGAPAKHLGALPSQNQPGSNVLDAGKKTFQAAQSAVRESRTILTETA